MLKKSSGNNQKLIAPDTIPEFTVYLKKHFATIRLIIRDSKSNIHLTLSIIYETLLN